MPQKHFTTSFFFLTALFIIAFGLNWLWEMTQILAYAGIEERSWIKVLINCSLASVGDGLLTVGVYLVAAFMLGRLRWDTNAAGLIIYPVMAFFGAVSAIAIELIALKSGFWSYQELMPIVPVLQVGLLPFLQLTLLPAALWLAQWRHKQRTLINTIWKT